jgi:hypothetical protein
MKKMEWRKDVCGINLIMEYGVCHAPKERKRIGVVQDSLVQYSRKAANYI